MGKYQKKKNLKTRGRRKMCFLKKELCMYGLKEKNKNKERWVKEKEKPRNNDRYSGNIFKNV